MFGATLKKTWDYYQDGFQLTQHDINLLLIGNVVAFIVALIAIKSFINYISKSGFKIFGYYRIIIGILLLIIHYFVHPLTLI
jgi:undecaprenyl-diphosphatase